MTTTDIGIKIPTLTAGKIPVNELPLATTTSNGILTATDKVKIDNSIQISDRESTTSPNAVASLVNGKIPTWQLPAIAINDIHVVSNEPDLIALTAAKQGDVGVVTGSSKSFILKNNDYFTQSNWVELLSPLSPVQSVAGKIGAVTLNIADITALQTTLNNKVETTNGTASNLTITDIKATDGFIEKTEIRSSKVRATSLTVAGGSSVTVDTNAAEYFKITATGTGNITVNFTNLQTSGFVGVIVLECVNFGGRTISWNPSNPVKWSGGNAPQLTTGTSSVDIISVIIDGNILKAGLTIGKDIK